MPDDPARGCGATRATRCGPGRKRRWTCLSCGWTLVMDGMQVETNVFHVFLQEIVHVYINYLRTQISVGYLILQKFWNLGYCLLDGNNSRQQFANQSILVASFNDSAADFFCWKFRLMSFRPYKLFFISQWKFRRRTLIKSRIFRKGFCCNNMETDCVRKLKVDGFKACNYHPFVTTGVILPEAKIIVTQALGPGMMSFRELTISFLGPRPPTWTLKILKSFRYFI